MLKNENPMTLLRNCLLYTSYISYSIANRTGLIVGFFGGLLSVLSGAGFFGAVITGFLGGYLLNALKKRIKVSRTYLPVMNIVVYPLIGTLAVFLACYFVINPLGNWITQSIVSLIGVIAVSYTHLDVYKRQAPLNDCVWRLAAHVPDCGIIELEALCAAGSFPGALTDRDDRASDPFQHDGSYASGLYGLSPVSYTHLV